MFIYVFISSVYFLEVILLGHSIVTFVGSLISIRKLFSRISVLIFSLKCTLIALCYTKSIFLIVIYFLDEDKLFPT